MTFLEFYAVIGAPAILLGLMALLHFKLSAKFLRSGQNRDGSR